MALHNAATQSSTVPLGTAWCIISREELDDLFCVTHLLKFMDKCCNCLNICKSCMTVLDLFYAYCMPLVIIRRQWHTEVGLDSWAQTPHVPPWNKMSPGQNFVGSIDDTPPPPPPLPDIVIVFNNNACLLRNIAFQVSFDHVYLNAIDPFSYTVGLDAISFINCAVNQSISQGMLEGKIHM